MSERVQAPLLSPGEATQSSVIAGPLLRHDKPRRGDLRPDHQPHQVHAGGKSCCVVPAVPLPHDDKPAASLDGLGLTLDADAVDVRPRWETRPERDGVDAGREHVRRVLSDAPAERVEHVDGHAG